MGTTIGTLAERLRVDPARLEALTRFTAAQLDALDSAVARAFEAEDANVADGMQHALSIVPRPLRGRAQAMLFPKGQDD